jgi:hypothetical protein
LPTLLQSHPPVPSPKAGKEEQEYSKSLARSGRGTLLLSEYDDPNITLSLIAFAAQIKITALYENIEIDAG